MPFNYQMDIKITNLDETQAGQLAQFLKVMQNCGDIGASRWMCFYVDGDGAFRPEIELDGGKIREVEGTFGRGEWGPFECINAYRVDCDG